jgi:multidrug resistance protein, MATE family
VIAEQVASIAFMIPMGLAAAITVRVGHARGRGDVNGVWFAALAGICITLFTQLISATIMLLFGYDLAVLWVPNAPAMAAMAASFMVYAAIFQFPDGMQVIAAGALRGLKDTRIPMLLTVVAYWCMAFPLAYYLCFGAGHGAPGLWVGLIAGLTIAAALLVSRFVWLSKRPERWAKVDADEAAQLELGIVH